MQNNLFAEGQLNPGKYSYSMLAIYEDCPFRYKLTYIDKVSSSKKQRFYIMMGWALHQVLYELYGFAKDKRNLNEMLDTLSKRWKKWNIDQQIEKKCYEQCKNILINYSNTFPLDSDVFIREHNIKQPFYGDILVGKIDRVDKLKDGTYEIIDYKLGDEIAKREDEIKKDLQWIFYWYSFKKEYYSLKLSKVTFIFLGANNKVSFSPTSEDERIALNELKSKIEKVKADKEFKKIPSKNCNNCYFYSKECC
jgi:DNA helicase-2/ATP-dependent DNA helicase PcrA